jgi:replicative DNA helicase
MDLERALLGCVLVESHLFGLVDGIVSADAFYAPAHQLVWSAFATLSGRDQPLDHATVRSELHDAGHLARVGGDEWLMSLTDVIPTTESALSYAKKIAAFATRRTIVAVAHEISAMGYDTSIPTGEFIDQAEARFLGVIERSASSDGLRHIAGALAKVAERIDRIAKAKGGGVTGLRTGLAKLDEWTTGMHPGELIVVAGRPGMGKSGLTSSLILTAGAIAARERDGVVAIFSLEMDEEKVGSRLVAADGSINIKSMRAARLDRDSTARMVRSFGKVSDLPIYVDDTPGTSISSVRSKARRLRASKGRIRLVVLDYLQLVEGTNKRMSREEAIAATSRGLKNMARELGCPVVALSQLNRKVEERHDKRPQMADIRESGAIEQDADTIWLLYRKGYYAALASKEAPPPKSRSKYAPESSIEPGIDDGIAEIIIAKQREGEVGSVFVRFNAESAHFVDQDQDRPHWSTHE